MKNKLLFGAIVLGVATFGFSTDKASAFDLTPCPSLAPITTATACQYVYNPLSSQGNDFADVTSVFSSESTPMKVNVNNVNEIGETGIESFFDISTWQLAGKLDDPAGTLGLIKESGTLDISSIYSQYKTVMAVFKSGNNTTLVGYLLDGSSSFSWSNPWAALNITGTQPQGISHISFYGTDPVPTPVAVLPILGGLFGAAFRRQKKESLS